MITNFKLFETINVGKPEIGDFVICNEDDSTSEVTYFTSNNIGKYIKYNYDIEYHYAIYYEDTPKDLGVYFSNGERNMTLDEIKYWSKNKEELEYIIKTNKFNL